MLDTIHPEEFYASKSTVFPGLGKIISGETTLQDTLDRCIHATDEPSLEIHHAMHFLSESEGVEYTGLPYVTEKELNLHWSGLLALGSVCTLGVVATVALTVTAMTPLLVPGLIAGAAFGVGGSAGIGRLTNYATMKFVERERKKMLVPLSEAARELDEDIGRHFFREHYLEEPNRFKRTYHSLSGEEMDIVDDELYRMLEAGILQTDEATLTKQLYTLRNLTT